MTDGRQRIALLIDAENVGASNIDRILTELARHGSANLRRAYGNWKSGNISDWDPMLQAHAIRPMQQFSYSPGKNASDMAMTVDAMDLLHDGCVEAFGLVSSDADFTPLAMRLVSGAMQVYGFGRPDTPDAFKNACTTFTPLDAPVKALPKLKKKKATAALAKPKTPVRDEDKLRADTNLHKLLRSAVHATKADSGWADLAKVGMKIREETSFDQSSYGYRRLGDLMAATERFEVRLGQARYKSAA